MWPRSENELKGCKIERGACTSKYTKGEAALEKSRKGVAVPQKKPEGSGRQSEGRAPVLEMGGRSARGGGRVGRIPFIIKWAKKQ